MRKFGDGGYLEGLPMVAGMNRCLIVNAMSQPLKQPSIFGGSFPGGAYQRVIRAPLFTALQIFLVWFALVCNGFALSVLAPGFASVAWLAVCAAGSTQTALVIRHL